MSILPIINTGGNPDDALQWSVKSNANFQFLNDQIEAINNTSPAAPPTQNTYQDNDQMVLDYANQSIGFFQYVQDARTPLEVSNGYEAYPAYYEYLGLTNNDVTDYRKLSQQGAQQLLATPFNQLTIKQITADNVDFTSANHGVSFVYNQENNCIDYVVFSPAFSKYMLNYMGYLEGYNLVLQVWNTTEGKAIALNITDLQFTNSTEVFIKAVVENTVVISDINVADVVNIDVSTSKDLKRALIEKKESNGDTVVFLSDLDTDISRGAKLLEVFNSASSGDYITVYQGVYEAYIPIQANLDNVTIEFKDGAILTSDGTRDLISNDDTYDITLNITGRGVFINTSIIGNKDRAINISDATTLNIQGKKLISQEGVCIRVDKVFGGGSIINAKFDYYGSKDGTFDNVDNTSVYNLYGDYAVSSENFVLENDGGIINCYIKTIEALDANPIERATSGVINVYNSLIIAPTGEVLANNLSTPENLNFYNCTGVCDVDNPIQTYYTGTIFINSDFYTDSGALFADKTDNTPAVKKDIVDNFVRSTGSISETITGKKTFSSLVEINDVNPLLRCVVSGSGVGGLDVGNDSDPDIGRFRFVPSLNKWEWYTGGAKQVELTNSLLTVIGSVVAGGYKSSNDILTTAFTFVNGNTGSLDYTVSNGRLIINGTFDATGASSNAIIGTLPAGARPNTTRTKIFYQGNGVLELEINSNGPVKKTTNSTETFDIDFEITLDLASV